MGCPEPQMDGGSGFVEAGSRCDRNLGVAAGALPEESLRQLEATGRTPESFGPPAGKEGITTSGVIWEAGLGLDDRPKEVRPRHATIVPELNGYAELADVERPPQIPPRAFSCVW